jgi:hypothetical protein
VDPNVLTVQYIREYHRGVPVSGTYAFCLPADKSRGWVQDKHSLSYFRELSNNCLPDDTKLRMGSEIPYLTLSRTLPQLACLLYVRDASISVIFFYSSRYKRGQHVLNTITAVLVGDIDDFKK